MIFRKSILFSFFLSWLSVYSFADLPPSIKVYFTDPLSATPSRSILSSEYKAIDEALIDFIDSMPQGSTCYLAIYEMNRPGILSAFNRATARGVKLYAIGHSTTTTPSASSIWGLVNASSYTRVHTTQYMHNKFVVLKDSAVWTGSYNFTDSATNEQDNNAVLIYSKELAELYEKEFKNMWDTKNFAQAKGTSTINASEWNGKEINVDGVKIKVFFNPYNTPNDIKQAIMNEIEGFRVPKPEEDIYFAMAWMTQEGIIDAIKTVSGTGIKTAGVLDDSDTNWGSYYSFKNSSAAVVFDSRRTIFGAGLLHHKFGVIDPGRINARVITGSANWTDAGTTLSSTSNDENILIIYSPELSKRYYKEFLRIFNATGEGIKSSKTVAISDVIIYPSPATTKTNIGYSLSNNVVSIKIKIYNLSGEVVSEWSPPNIYCGLYNETEWDLKNMDGRRVAPGVYFVKVEAVTPDGTFFAVKKMAVTK